jgi:hypothetical protein
MWPKLKAHRKSHNENFYPISGRAFLTRNLHQTPRRITPYSILRHPQAQWALAAQKSITVPAAEFRFDDNADAAACRV